MLQKQSDHFCYICEKRTYSSERKGISDFVKRGYLAYFGMPLGDQGKSWAPHIVCSFSYSSVHAWQKKKPNRHLNFAVPMALQEIWSKNAHFSWQFSAQNDWLLQFEPRLDQRSFVNKMAQGRPLQKGL